VLRTAARRAGWVDKAVPQAVEGRLARRYGKRSETGVVHHQLLAELMHLGYGLFWGALFGAAHGRRRHAVGAGAALGLGVWVSNVGALLPALDVLPPPWRSSWRQNLLNVSAHLLYGAATGLITDELGAQSREHSAPSWRRFNPSVG
jgi:uncharacterized membrane protein YagU involved in acid resistance